jgi:hypothetical protein
MKSVGLKAVPRASEEKLKLKARAVRQTLHYQIDQLLRLNQVTLLQDLRFPF